MHHVYRGINASTGEIYHGVSKEPQSRKDGSHCSGGTKALKHWKCEIHDIRWNHVSSHHTQSKASEEAHKHEKTYRHRDGHKNIKTRGI